MTFHTVALLVQAQWDPTGETPPGHPHTSLAQKTQGIFLLNISAEAVWLVMRLYLLAIKLPQVCQLNLKGFIDQQSVVYSVLQPSRKIASLLFSKEAMFRARHTFLKQTYCKISAQI